MIVSGVVSDIGKMEDDLKNKLVNLGAEVLADALLELAQHSGYAVDLTERLLATPDQNLQRFKNKMADLLSMNRFVSYHESAKFAQCLASLLQDLRAAVKDPLAGVELVLSFFEADECIFENCDDSSGDVGDVFCHDAAELFVEFASRCEDMEKVADMVLRVCLIDNYGVRDPLIDNASRCLPLPTIRRIISDLQKLAVEENDKYRKSHIFSLIESLARQIKDAKLFEQTCLAHWEKINPSLVHDIAKAYLEAEDVESAWNWLHKYPEEKAFQSYERDQLLMNIYRLRGENDSLADLLRAKFQKNRSVAALNELLDVVGHDHYDSIVEKEVHSVSMAPDFDSSDAEFLVDIGKVKEAEAYLIDRASKINGDYYGSLLSLNEKFAVHHCYLAVTLIYRIMLLSILKRSYAKAYAHAVDYLQELDKLEGKIADWKGFSDHKAFKNSLKAGHARKWKFWSAYKSVSSRY